MPYVLHIPSPCITELKFLFSSNLCNFTFQVLGSSHEYHFVHHGLPHARKKRSVGHLRLLKADPHIAEAVQQTGFLRVKRGYGLAKAGLSADDMALSAMKKSPWVSLREALDGGLQVAPDSVEQDFDSHIVHDEGFFNRMQYSANHKYLIL